MHMRKVRTTINLNEDVVRKAKSLKINISAIAERGIIDYIKELENIGRESTSYSNYNIDNDDRQSSIRKASRNKSMDLSGFEPEASSMPRRRSSELIYKPDNAALNRA
jgi:post-segregation antitoxin (ccd killing protein)